jgi:preprotein translocase subunit YajC
MPMFQVNDVLEFLGGNCKGLVGTVTAVHEYCYEVSFGDGKPIFFLKSDIEDGPVNQL